jgi:hypothetical protein
MKKIPNICLFYITLVTVSPYTPCPGPAFVKSALFRRTLPPAIVEILARIPLNIIDRLLSVFGGCGVAALLRLAPPRQTP